MTLVPTARGTDPLGLLYLVLAVVGWGSNWPPMKLLLAELPPLTTRAVPGLASALLLATVALASGASLRVPRRTWGLLVLASLLNITAWMGFTTLALLWLGAGETCIIAYTVPIWASLLAWPVLGERPGGRTLLGLACALAGLVLVVGGDSVALGAGKLPGVLLALGSAVLFAFGTVLMKWRPLPLPPLASVAWQVALGMLPLVVGAALLERPALAQVSPRAWVLLAYSALGPLGFCYVAWFAALRRLPTAVATTGTLLAPVVGVLASAAVLGEPLGPRQIGALALVLGGVVLVARR